MLERLRSRRETPADRSRAPPGRRSRASSAGLVVWLNRVWWNKRRAARADCTRRRRPTDPFPHGPQPGRPCTAPRKPTPIQGTAGPQTTARRAVNHNGSGAATTRRRLDENAKTVAETILMTTATTRRPDDVQMTRRLAARRNPANLETRRRREEGRRSGHLLQNRRSTKMKEARHQLLRRRQRPSLTPLLWI